MLFKELDYQKTPFGEISLRVRAEPRLDGKIIYEVKLGDEFLMSSLFPEAEIQLAHMGLDALAEVGKGWDVVVGGLGLGYTAAAALEHANVRSLHVVDVMQPVIDWHRNELVPVGAKLNADQRCTLVHADFFALTMDASRGYFNDDPLKLAHALLLDIDHSPSHWLNPQNAGFYSQQGLNAVSAKLHESGVFALWSNDPPEPDFITLLASVFSEVESHVVTFPNPYSGATSTNTVYVAVK